MPIWSLTQERVDKLKDQMTNKKSEIDALANLSEKDLWCQDLDAFIESWEEQLREDAEIQKSIRSKGRRVSRKIGAGKPAAGKGRTKEDDDFEPGAKAAKNAKPNPAKGVVKIEQKPHKRFLEMFAPKPKKPAGMGMGSDGTEDASDEDFAALAPVRQTSRAPSEQPANRSKRAAAAAPKNWIVDEDDSESDDGKFLGDVGAMVKGIGEDNGSVANGGMLFSMSRPGTSHGERPSSSGMPKLKSKPSRTFDLVDADDTNYEMLAKSPNKAAPLKDDLDSFLSDDELPIKAKVKPVAKEVKKAPAKKEAPVAKKPAQPKPMTLSPAAKAYAAKQNKIKMSQQVFSDDEDEDMIDAGSPPPKAASRKPSKVVDSDNDVPAKPKARGRAKNLLVDSDDDMVIAKPKAKAAARGRPTKKTMLSDDDDDLMDDVEPAPKPTGRGRPARAAAAAPKAKPIYVDSEDEEESEGDVDESVMVDDDSEDFDDDE